MCRIVNLFIILIFCLGCGQNAISTTTVAFSKDKVTIDGKADEPSWSKVPWKNLDQLWLGDPISAHDFEGRYKMLWDHDHLYVLAEIHDDVLMDQYNDGLSKYWDDDCLEIFVDEDCSKGNHQFNHSAFAYHVALDGRVADIGPDSLPHYYNEHVMSERITEGNKSTWECAIKIYDDSYKDGQKNLPKGLATSKKIGFALAYCDNDHSEERENFIGSIYVEGEDKNKGWIDAGIFEEIILVD